MNDQAEAEQQSVWSEEEQLQGGRSGSEDQQQDDRQEGTTVDDDNDRSLSHICSSVRGCGLPRGRIGDIANASCNSGLFNGRA